MKSPTVHCLVKRWKWTMIFVYIKKNQGGDKVLQPHEYESKMSNTNQNKIYDVFLAIDRIPIITEK